MSNKRKRASLKPSDTKKNYNLKDFVFPASDPGGVSARLQFRCSPGYARRVDIIVHSRRFPYKTPTDIYRHALDRHLKWLSELEPGLPLDLPTLEVVNKITREQRERQQFMKSFAELKPTLFDLIGAGAEGEAARIVGEVLTEVQRMEPGHWRDKFLEEVTRHFGHLLEQKKAETGGGDR